MNKLFRFLAHFLQVSFLRDCFVSPQINGAAGRKQKQKAVRAVDSRLLQKHPILTPMRVLKRLPAQQVVQGLGSAAWKGSGEGWQVGNTRLGRSYWATRDLASMSIPRNVSPLLPEVYLALIFYPLSNRIRGLFRNTPSWVPALVAAIRQAWMNLESYCQPCSGWGDSERSSQGWRRTHLAGIVSVCEENWEEMLLPQVGSSPVQAFPPGRSVLELTPKRMYFHPLW